MFPNFFPTSFLLFVIIMIVSTLIHVPSSVCADDEQYVTCGESFNCANIENITYPFWGGSRPESCGYPGFELTNCQGDAPLITIETLQYRVLAIDYTTPTLTVAREDMWNNTCPTDIYNTTINSTGPFSIPSNQPSVTLLYGCPLLGVTLHQFTCNSNSLVYFFLTDTTNSSINLSSCGNSVIVPVNQTSAQALLSATASVSVLEAALAGGFGLQWSANNTRCTQCVESSGRCGSNTSSTAFTCYCADQPHSLTCSTAQPANKGSCNESSTVGSRITPPSPNAISDSTSSLSTQMPLFSPFITVLLVITFISHLTTSFSQDPTFSNCNRTFSCGSLHNITYPFTGADRPDHCGPPDFKLVCRHNSTAELTANSLTYRVLQINQTQQTLTLARLDIWNDTCPRKFLNSTLNSTIFTYSSENEDLTLIYGCNSTAMHLKPYNLFSCNLSGVRFSDAYYLIGPLPKDPILDLIRCSVCVTVPVLKIAGDELTSNRTTLGETLTEGFSVKYSDPYDKQCLVCSGSGGQCGFDSNSGQPVCICGDRLCFPAGPAGNNNKGSQLDVVLPVVGAILAGIGIGWLIFFCRQRRKRLAAESVQTAESKDLPTPLSSKGLTTTPSTHFTRSIPSYPSSKSDLGKGSTYFGTQIFSYSELEEATDNFDPSRELGDGGFGTVYYGKLHDGREVAVKRLYENNFKRVEQFMNEVEILTRLHHQYLVKLYGCTSKRSRELLLVYEYISNGTVADHLHGKRANSGLLSWPVRLNIAIETADALAYLHVSDIIHRDVKSNNILLDNDFCVKVADFGLSRLFPNDATHVSTAPQGTPGYVDPEYYQCYQLTDKSDVYSFGVVLIELISSLQAVDTNRHRQEINLANMAMNKIQNHTLHELVDPSLGFETNSSVRRMTTLVAELAFRCLQQEKDMRPSMKDVLDTLRGIQNEELNVQKAEVVDIIVDDIVPLKGNPSPPSPDSAATDKWVNSSTPNSIG